ncbi:hypothetical protein [Proteiniphilum sp. X52]|uniref:hypothetical protein n=1 Tax=Proteiniphilum sp. X52 TaxID=2382159 RepID=UPI0013140EE6|nr:hypothetical protein [Proteiniphilum sp. X52]
MRELIIESLSKKYGDVPVLENGKAYFRTESLSDIEKEYQREAEERVKNLFSGT